MMIKMKMTPKELILLYMEVFFGAVIAKEITKIIMQVYE